MYHGMGHFNACFRLAKILKKDHEVIFAGFISFKEYIESQGFIFYPLRTIPFGLGFEKWTIEQEKRKLSYLWSVVYRWSDRLYKRREWELHKLIKDLSPTHILIDSYQSTDFIVLYSQLLGNMVKVGFVQIMLPMTVSQNGPPLNSDVFPSDKSGIKRARRKFSVSLLKRRWKQKFLFFGMDDSTIIKRRMRLNKFPHHYRSSEKIWRGISFINIDELVVAPKEFDFEDNHRTFSHYVGFMPDLYRLEISDTEYFKIDSVIRNQLNETQGTLLYCSFGSVNPVDAQPLYTFLQKLIHVVRDQNCVLIISVNAIDKSVVAKDLPANVFILKAVPQLEILARTDVFIHHGGINSIKESIYAGVPMLVYPFDENTDRIGNAARVVYYKLGLRGDLQNDSEEEISDKLTELINNDLYRKNIYELREKDMQYEGEFLKRFRNLAVLG